MHYLNTWKGFGPVGFTTIDGLALSYTNWGGGLHRTGTAGGGHGQGRDLDQQPRRPPDRPDRGISRSTRFCTWNIRGGCSARPTPVLTLRHPAISRPRRRMTPCSRTTDRKTPPGTVSASCTSSTANRRAAGRRACGSA